MRNYSTPLSYALRVLCLGLGLSSLTIGASQAQSPTPGLIFKPATAGTPGSAVLDPNGDGYVSASASGFSTAAGDIGSQSEIPYRYLPQVMAAEPNADLRAGPSNKFTDFADVAGGGAAVGFYVDANSNYLFRFRLGGSAPNSKGYSIAIDTDNKFGFSGPNADPNAVPHNPGFEMEIVLDTNFGVRLYNLDGLATPTGTGPGSSLVELPYESYAQKAIALTTNGGDLDVFYDFYIPLAVIQQYFGSQTYFNSTGTTAVPFTLNTPLRMVANTLIAPHNITQYQSISDIGGLNDVAQPNPDNAFAALVTGATPTSGAALPSTSGNSIPARSAAPMVSSPIQTAATTVNGTSTEAVGTMITVYVNGVAQSTTTTVQTGGAWSLGGLPALASGALVKATATTAGKSQSEYSNEVRVSTTGTTCTTAIPSAPTCLDASGRGISGAAPVGYSVYLHYLDGSLVPTSLTTNPIVVTSSGTYLFTGKGGNATTCSTGQPNAFSGSYLLTQAAPGGCESAGYQVCVGTVTTATPVVTSPKPITPNTTSISGTATAGASVLLYLDGSLFSSTTATGGNFTFSGSTLPALTTGHTMTIYATVNQVSNASGSCQSAGVALNIVTPRAVTPPSVNSPLLAGATTVSGTSVEAAGSTITLTTYTAANGTGTAAATYTTTVQSTGTWSVAVAALASGSVKATVAPADYGTSSFSNVVAVQTQTASVPVITSSYVEGGTSVTGTSAAAVGSVITVYEDGDALGTTTVASGGTWTLGSLSNGSGISPNTAYPTLYTGGVLTGTATEAGKLPSGPSAGVAVGCAPITDKTFTNSAVCQNQTASFSVANVTPGVVYSLQDATSGSNVQTGVSRVGTSAGTLTIPTSVFTTAGTYAIKLNAFSVGATSCSQTTATSVPLTVNPLAVEKAVSAQNGTLGPNNAGTTINVASSQPSVSYQLVNATATPNSNVGSPQTGTGGTLALPTGPIAANTTYAVVAVTAAGCTSRLSQTQQVRYSSTPLPVSLVAFEAVAQQRDAVLSWRTASEQHSAYFDVEHSADGLHFSYCGRVAAAGSSAQLRTYTFTEAGSARLGRQVYYRLRQADTNGDFTFSPVRTVAFSEAQVQPAIVLYPNPASTTLTLNLASLPADVYAVSVLSATGQLLSTRSLVGGQAHDLSVAALPTGLYVVRIQGATLSEAHTFVKAQ
jgi:hypothetical protein